MIGNENGNEKCVKKIDNNPTKEQKTAQIHKLVLNATQEYSACASLPLYTKLLTIFQQKERHTKLRNINEPKFKKKTLHARTQD